MTLTPAELDELADLEAKATRGPWRPKREPPPVGNVWFDEHTRDGSAPIEGQGGPGALGTAVGVAVNLCDADLTAALRNHAPALLAMARRLGELQYRWGEFSASNLANLHSLNAQLTAATARAAELDAALTTALADAEMAEHAHDACEELLTAATDRAEALQAEVTAAYDRGLAHGKGPNWQQGYYNLADGVLLLTKERDTADARAQAAEKRCGEYEKALRRIADGDAGHQGSFDWPEFYESIRKHAREALAAAKGGG